MEHNPYVLLETRMPDINQGDIVKLKWDDYMVDDASGTDDAVIRLYASSALVSHTTMQSLESAVVGEGGAEDTYIINSSNGRTTGTITSITEADSSFNWDTRTSSFSFPKGEFSVHGCIRAHGPFSANARTAVRDRG